MKKLNVWSIISLALLVINLLVPFLFIYSDSTTSEKFISLVPAIMYFVAFLFSLPKKYEYAICYPKVISITSLIIGLLSNPIISIFSLINSFAKSFG